MAIMYSEHSLSCQLASITPGSISELREQLRLVIGTLEHRKMPHFSQEAQKLLERQEWGM